MLPVLTKVRRITARDHTVIHSAANSIALLFLELLHVLTAAQITRVRRTHLGLCSHLQPHPE